MRRRRSKRQRRARPRRPARAALGALGLLGILTLACAHSPTTTPLRFSGGGSGTDLLVPGLARCTPEQPAAVELDPDRPVVLLVHGCYASGGRFRSLAEVFELHGQQTLCFNYDYRESLRASGERLRGALAALRARMRDPRVTVVGHSQGGLVSRVALSGPEATPELGLADTPDYRLVTVSSPFAGIRAARDCGLVPLHVASLGVSVAVCQIVAGSTWREIHARSPLVTEPPRLAPAVESHLAVVTDERDSCRRRRSDGRCAESDYVFAVAEQENPRLLGDERVRQHEVVAGHVEIVGSGGVRPTKLLRALQRHGILAPTPPERREELARLLARLF